MSARFFLDTFQVSVPLVDGELLLDAGGSRLPSPAERTLLEWDAAHAERPATALPYRYQTGYGRSTEQRQLRVAELDNGVIRARFLLDLGGRLWQLTDLRTGRELLHQPDRIQFANFAIRDAWFAGGVEWNLGLTGHWGLTCEPISASLIDENTVRMWGHERILGLTWRLDAWLPPGAGALHTHVVIHNPSQAPLPVYWWTNIAVPQTPDTRVIVDARSALHFGYLTELQQCPVPGTPDATRPGAHPGCADYFYSARSPWLAVVERDGCGLGQSSTPELAGRKLFTWGAGRGGASWQSWLSGRRSYAEVQAGLARTQVEHLRLDPGETIRFTEALRPIHVDVDPMADWSVMVEAGRRAAHHPDELAAAAAHLRSVEAEPATIDDVGIGTSRAQGWGALEVFVGHRHPDPSTPFDPALMDDEQRAWRDLALTGAVDERLATSALVGPEWTRRLEAAQAGWVRDLLLGHARLAAGDVDSARRLWTASVREHDNPDARRALGLTAVEESAGADELVTAHRLAPTRPGIAIESLTALLATDRIDDALDLVGTWPPELTSLPRVSYLICTALVRRGDAQAASALLNGPLVLTDLREGDFALDQLWDAYQRLLGTAEPLPAHYDFRMQDDSESDRAWT